MPNWVKLESLRRHRGSVLILAFLVSCLVHWRAPPDVTPMAIMAVSMYLLFEVGLFVSGLLIRR